MAFLLVLGMTPIAFVSAQRPADNEKSTNLQTDSEAREEKIDEILTDMTVRRDRLLKRFAVVLHGEYVTLGSHANPLLIHPIVMARVVDQERDFDLKAMYLVYPDLAEVGDEIVKIKGKTKYRETATLLHGPYEIPPEGMSRTERQNFFWNRHAWAHDPYDDYILGPYGIKGRDNHLGIEQAMREFQLSRTDPGPGGSIVSHWAYSPNKSANFRYRIDFSPADQWMPVRFSGKDLLYTWNSLEARYHWKKTGGFLLPDRIQTSMGSASNKDSVNEAVFRLKWLIGDEVPDEIFTAEDHLAVLLDQFDIPHSELVNGQVVRAPHPLPEDLYEGWEPLNDQGPRPKR
ncbi:hypothetical protein [Allorhodopirellula heiligendammensis]|nr:hypothetical protein [Allorhodopirellula heiligendammensis]